ncbi:MAG: hypothetical protein P8164_12685 [Gammaproteobacteria bacterium]|jgi:hypothetical protein
MKNAILLARPHPFIVSEMKPFLEQSGFTPLPVKDIRQLAGLALTSFSGAIISLAVQSTINESAEMVFEAIRKQSPYLPVAFAGMLDAAMASKAIKRMLLNQSKNAMSLLLRKPMRVVSNWGRHRPSFIYATLIFPLQIRQKLQL